MAKTTKRESFDAPAEGEKRKTYLISIELSDKLDWIAYWERLKIKDVINAAASEYITKYEKKNGPVKSPPVQKK